MGDAGVGRDAEPPRRGLTTAAPRAGGDPEPWSADPLAGRVLGVMMAVGCAATIPAVLLDATPGSRKPSAFVVVCLALAAAVVLLHRGRRGGPGISRAVCHGALTLSLAVITAATWFGKGGTTSVAATGFFSWPPLFACAFFPWGEAWPYLVASAGLGVAVVATTVHQTPITCGISTVGTVVVGAVTARYVRALLVQRSTTDSLTRLPNRQALPVLLRRAQLRARRFGTALTLAVIDLDNFKEVNDTGGHRAGDDVLRNEARRWRQGLRRDDDVIRYGGDEFVVLLGQCDADQAAPVMDTLRRSGQPCSIGVAQWVPGEPVDAALARADAALHRAKREGRGRIVTAATDVAAGPPRPARRAWLARWQPTLRLPAMAHGPSSAVQAEVLGGLYAMAGATALPSLFLDPVPHSNTGLVTTIALAAIGAGVAIFAAARRMGPRFPAWIVHVGMTFAVFQLCDACVLAKGGLAGIISLGLMSWAAIYLGAFFPWRVMAVYGAMATVGIPSAVLATVHDNPVGVALLEVVTALGAGSVIAYLARLLQRQSRVDSLTQLPNRSALAALVDREIATATRDNGSLSVAIIDLDHLKTVNDTLGHLAGDEVLRDFSAFWTGRLRPADQLIRYGGDEFVLLMPGYDLSRARHTLSRIRSSGAPACSVGLTQWGPLDTSESLIARADAALYLAKDQGRDQIATLAAAS